MPNVMEKPVFAPYVCVSCGSQDNRDWFVDLHLNLDNYLNPVIDGQVILCNLCFDALVNETYGMVEKLFPTIAEGVAPTYEDMTELLTEVPYEPGGTSGPRTTDDVRDSATTEPDPATSNDDQSDGGGDSGEENGESDGGLRNFRGFFGQSSP